LAAVESLRSAISAQPAIAPSPAVRQQLLAQIKTRRPAPRLFARPIAWLVGSAVALVLLVALWFVVQPGIALQWSVAGTGASTYRVYRAPVNGEEFNLISEVPARSDSQAYSFTDITSLPGQTYTYVIEAVTRDGQTTLSPFAVGRGLDVLPAQLALVLTSLVVGAAAMALVSNSSRPAINRRLMGA
jgi:lipopolysaccharide/colanic/teichoic acid biosynthesis glycosyltransferase